MDYIKLILIYFSFITIISIVLTLYDKSAAQKYAYRVPEKVLLFVGFLGGALGEYIVMKIIHHKTLHKKFMIGLPIEIILHIAIITAVAYLYLK